MTTRKIW